MAWRLLKDLRRSLLHPPRQLRARPTAPSPRQSRLRLSAPSP